MKNNANDNQSKLEELIAAFNDVKSIANKAQAAVIIAEHNVAIAREITNKATVSVKMMEEHLKKLEGDINKK